MARSIQALDLGAHFDAQLGVEVDQGLIKQKQLRVTRQGTPHGDAPTLATRELRRSAVQQLLDLQHGGHLMDAFEARRFGHVVQTDGDRLAVSAAERHPVSDHEAVDEGEAQDKARRDHQLGEHGFK